MTITEIIEFMERFAPTRLAESWDNVGLLIGEHDAQVSRVLTCLTITPQVVREAVEQQVDLIVSHHPMPFQAVKKITDSTTVGRMILSLTGSQIAVYSPHTGFDSAAGGINRQLADAIELTDIQTLIETETDDPATIEGTGRIGRLPTAMPLDELARSVAKIVSAAHIDVVGDSEQQIETVAIACGAADSLLDDAVAAGADCLLLGEARFHACLEAQAQNVGLIMPGHYASERFALVRLAEQLAEAFPELTVTAAESDVDPIRRFG